MIHTSIEVMDMFSRKRRFYEKKSFYAAVVTAFVAVFAFGLWFNGEPASDPKQQTEKVPDVMEEAQASVRGLSEKKQDDQGDVEQNPDVAVSGAEVLNRPLNQGYFVIEEDGYIHIYQVDAQGNKAVLRTSEILFDLLSAEDQEMFRLGVELENEDQLMELLQDFES